MKSWKEEDIILIHNNTLVDARSKLIATISDSLPPEQLEKYLHLFAMAPRLLTVLEKMVSSALDAYEKLKPQPTLTGYRPTSGGRTYPDLDLTTPGGRALAGMLAVFAEFERDILRDRVKAGIAQARKEGCRHGRPLSVAVHKLEIKRLFRKGVSKREIAKRLKISLTSVRRLLGNP